jgi:hypothetical protein
MRDTLGFDFEFKSKIGTMSQDPFGGQRGNALAAFFSKFTANYVVSVLTDYINEKKDVMYQIMSMIHRNEDLTDEEKTSMGIDIENCQSEKLTEKGTEYILIKKQLLVIKN